jgi:hypothetical protein
MICVAAASMLGAAEPAAPTKEQAIEHLGSFLAALEANDFDNAAAHVAKAPNVTAEETKKTFKRLLEMREISKEGIEVLASHGQWGKLTQLKADKGPAWAKRYNLPAEECYVLAHPEGAEAAFHFDGKSLKIIRCDDIGKLKK